MASIGDGGTGKSIAELRALADQARSRRDFNADAFYRRLILELEPDRASNSTQYAHALKEIGFHDRARDLYLRAIELGGPEAELQIELAHVAKFRGAFADAERAFERAAALGFADTENIAFERRLLRQIDPGSRVAAAGLVPPLRVYLSVPGGALSESTRSSLVAGLGHGDYSYAFAMRGFVDALEALEIDHEVIRNPEYIADIRERSDAPLNIHLSFYPPERMRLLKGAYNINCFAWEFDRLRKPEEDLSGHPFANQAAMLNLADEIWMPSAHGADAVRPDVTVPVYEVPAPVLHNIAETPRPGRPSPRERQKAVRKLSQVAWRPLAILPRMQPHMNVGSQARELRLPALLDTYLQGKDPLIFVSVFNAHDYRKQIAPMLRGFVEFARDHPDAILLCKVTTVDRGSEINDILFREQLMEIDSLTPPLISEKVWLTRDVLTREEMVALYDVADHYVCTSHAEGQNLPLIEAMGRGVVAVSTDGTAMDAYIDDQTAVVIETERRPFGRRLTSRYGMYGLETNFTTTTAVRDALASARHLNDDEYGARSSAGLARVKALYGLERFKDAFEGLTDRLNVAEVSGHD
ncbi:hypothetical protein MMB232_03183 [Brevundimonas subvibrioides]|uniref:glycosyltransferase n=1 Tax=Brevundimonas subvibrioides TaxID=74313 RepID=UPI0032D56B51